MIRTCFESGTGGGLGGGGVSGGGCDDGGGSDGSGGGWSWDINWCSGVDGGDSRDSVSNEVGGLAVELIGETTFMTPKEILVLM